jgi:hypothetical protein
MKYPFNRLKIVSVPIHFFTYLQPWSLSTDHTQPEFILVPEYGGGSWRLAVTRLHEDFTKEAQRQGNEPEEQEIQARMFILLTGNTFLYPQYMLLRRGQNINYPITNWNRTQVLPLYYNYAYQIQEPGLPTFQIMLEQALQERDNNRNPNNNQSQYQGLLALKRKCLAEWIQQGVMNDTTIELLNLSGIQFFSEVSALSPNGDFIDAFEYPLANFKFQNSSPDQWLNNADVSADLTSRYNSRMQKKKIPAFKFGHIETAEIKKEGKTKYFFSLEVFNYGEANGPLTTQTFFVDLSENRARSYAQWQYQNMTDDANVEKRLFNVPAKSKVRLEFVFDQLPGNLEINTNLSENIPPQYHFGLNFSENNHVQPNTGMVVLDSLIQDDESNKDKESGIYIVDNEDDGFTIDSKDEIRTLKDWWLQRKSNKIKEYSGFNHWNPNPVWSSSLNTNYHGEYLRSAVFKAAGNGKDRARWRCNLKEAGNYEVQVHIPNELHTRWRQRDVPAEFNYHIHHANGSSTFTTPNLRNRTGWISLGHFFFNEGEAVVELSDKTEFPYVVADAAKWIKR